MDYEDQNNMDSPENTSSQPSHKDGYILSPDTKMERRREEDVLGADIIDECRTQLMLKFRFLDMALWRMDLEPFRVGAFYPLATNGKAIFYDPPRVIGRFQESYEESIRDYLHMIMHCIFRHPYEKNKKDKDAWNLTCDIIIENAVIDLCGTRFKSDDDLSRMMELSKIKMAAGGMTPGKIYDLILNLQRTADGQQFRGISANQLTEWRDLFERDDHGAWPMHAKPEQTDETSDQSDQEEFSENDDDPDMESDGLRSDSPEGQSSENEDGQRDRNQNVEESEDGNASENQIGSNDGEDADSDEQDTDDEDKSDDDPQPDTSNFQSSENDASHSQNDVSDDKDDNEKEWEDISKQIEMNLTTFSKEWAEEAASFLANLQLANRKKHDYTEFLRKFMVVSEEMLLNMDEFDNIFYTFGIDLYGNMPLIEPLEYKETKRIHDFAIVIDTSESVRGALVRKFIEHTFDILKDSQDYSREINVHVIQADNKIQSDTRLRDLHDVDALMSNFVIRGMGGTDFRPAFDYIEMLRNRGEFDNLKGLIYFTDGYGQFPEKAPDFDAAFVFIDDEERQSVPVPPWAIKLIVDEESL